MNPQKLVCMLAVGLSLGCAGTDAESGDQQLDAKHGSFKDSKADAGGLTAQQQQVVLDYANQPFTDDAAFLSELDAELNLRAARGIVAFRLGPDGRIGTADDRTFDNVEELDAVPYVGTHAFRGLVALAQASGYQAPGDECLEAMQLNGGGLYLLDLEDMKKLERSDCTHVAGNVIVNIERTASMPSRYWDLSVLHKIETIDGQLNIATSNDNLRDLTFPNLRRVGSIHIDVYVSPSPRVSFPQVTETEAITLEGVTAADFNRLTTIGGLYLDEFWPDVIGFGALTRAETLRLQLWGDAQTVNFPSLVHVDSLEITGAPDDVKTMNFGALRSAGDISLRGLQSSSPAFTALEAVEGGLQVSRSTQPGAWFPSLESVGGDVTIKDTRKLEELDMASLSEIGGSFEFSGASDGAVFNELQVVGGKLRATITSCANPDVNGFGRLSQVGAFVGIFGDGCHGRAFEAIEEVSGNVYVHPSTAMFGGLANLSAVLGSVEVGPANVEFASLDYVGGDLTATAGPVLEGLSALETVEGSVRFGRSSRTISGLQRIESVGGDIMVPRQMADAERQQFIDRLRHFDGAVRLY